MAGPNGPNLNPVAGQVFTYNGPTQQESWEFVTITNTVFAQLMLAWLQSLPTSLPATAGVPWNNGGTISIS